MGEKTDTGTFCNASDSHTYLRYEPAKCKEIIQFPQYLRLMRICSNDDDFLNREPEISEFTLKRSYPLYVIENAKRRVIFHSEALTGNIRNEDN